MKTITLSDAQIDALIIAAHSVMDGHLPPSEAEALEDAVLALRRARDASEHSDHAAEEPEYVPGRASAGS